MGENNIGWRGLLRAAAGCVCVAALASCSGGGAAPAPVVMRGAVLGTQDMAPEPAPIARPEHAAPHEAHAITVRPGQSLGGIAHTYHVPERAIIAANHLQPPYKLLAGMRLIIPGDGAPVEAAHTVERAAIPPEAERQLAEPSHDVIPLDGPAPKRNAEPPRTASPAAAEVAAEVAREGERDRGTAPEPKRQEHTWLSPPPAVHGGRFPWPVQGRVLANFGSGANGAHNDGINIAAAKGTPIRAVEGGVVAYAGNELRGYGNLVLIKHPDGLISAYAHCDEVSVKKGEAIRPGQTIGRVGATGGVAEPQLHFELRRGKQPVDPREFLAPGPSAGRTSASGHS